MAKKEAAVRVHVEPKAGLLVLHDVLVEIRNILEDMRELQADVARDVKKLEQARKF